MMMMMLVTTTTKPSTTEETPMMPPTAAKAAAATGAISSSSTSRRRRRNRSMSTSWLLFSLAATVVSVSIVSLSVVDAFSIRQFTRRLSRSNGKPGTTPPTTTTTTGGGGGIVDSEKFASHNDNNNNAESWSKSAGRRSSPLQVRRRVKAVLEKARTRTGINNSSTIASSVAEAASIGGLAMGDSDVVIKVERRNGDTDNSITTKSSSSSVSDGDRNGKTHPTSSSSSSSSTTDINESREVVVKPPRSSSSVKNSLDAIKGDFPAANRFCEPLPFKLPKLTTDQKRLLESGERIQEQSRMGREGSGFVVLDVNVPPYVVWECLLDFEAYPETIPTVREMQLYTSEKLNTGYVNEKPVLPGTGRETRHYGTPSVTRALFILSKFRLNIAAIHRYTPHPQGDYMEFTLDKSCTNMVLKGAKGIWYTEENPDGREGYTRVYLLCEVQISRALPSFIVDYAANRAMPRATTWLRPQVEAAGDLWLKRIRPRS